MSDKLIFPVSIPFGKIEHLFGLINWCERAGMAMRIEYSPHRRKFTVDAWLLDRLSASKLFNAVRSGARKGGEAGASYAIIKNHSFLRTSVPDTTVEWAIDQLCRTGELVRIDGVHKQSGKPLPRYKLGETE